MNSSTDAVLNNLVLAKECRKLIRDRYPRITSCVETAFLFDRTAYHLGYPVTRMVCQAVAFSPLLAEAVANGQEAKPLMDLPGYWAVGVGLPQFPGDFVGRAQPDLNRYVGHVVCITEDHLIDASVDQMHRPEKDLFLDQPVVCEIGEGPRVVAIAASGAVVQYTLHPDVPPPVPVTARLLERLAKGLAKSTRAVPPKSRKR